MHTLRNFLGNTFHMRLPQKNRIVFLDYLRGFLMILVLLHHADAPGSKYILQFHMPAMFLLSGFTEYMTGKSYSAGAYVKSKFFRLIVPYFCFEVLALILYGGVCLLAHLGMNLGSNAPVFSLPDALISIVFCLNSPYKGLLGRLWFLPAMFFSSVSVFLIKSLLCKDRKWFCALFIPLFLGLSYISSEYLPTRLPFCLDISFLGTAFMLLGYCIAPYLKRMMTQRQVVWDFVTALVGIGVVVVCNVVAEPVCLMYINQYTNFLSMVLNAFALTVLLFLLCKALMPVVQKVSLLHKTVTWYSIHSLAVFPIHLIIKIAALVVLEMAAPWSWAVLFGIMLVLSVPAVNFVAHYLPFLLGSRKK